MHWQFTLLGAADNRVADRVLCYMLRGTLTQFTRLVYLEQYGAGYSDSYFNKSYTIKNPFTGRKIGIEYIYQESVYIATFESKSKMQHIMYVPHSEPCLPVRRATSYAEYLSISFLYDNSIPKAHKYEWEHKRCFPIYNDVVLFTGIKKMKMMLYCFTTGRYSYVGAPDTICAVCAADTIIKIEPKAADFTLAAGAPKHSAFLELFNYLYHTVMASHGKITVYVYGGSIIITNAEYGIFAAFNNRLQIEAFYWKVCSAKASGFSHVLQAQEGSIFSLSDGFCNAKKLSTKPYYMYATRRMGWSPSIKTLIPYKKRNNYFFMKNLYIVIAGIGDVSQILLFDNNQAPLYSFMSRCEDAYINQDAKYIYISVNATRDIRRDAFQTSGLQLCCQTKGLQLCSQTSGLQLCSQTSGLQLCCQHKKTHGYADMYIFNTDGLFIKKVEYRGNWTDRKSPIGEPPLLYDGRDTYYIRDSCVFEV